MATLNEQLDVGVFSANLGDACFARARILSMQRVAIDRGEQDVRIITKRKPFFAGVDPYPTFVDRNTNDNILSVTPSRR